MKKGRNYFVAKTAIKMFTAWSFSRWKDHNECPLKAKLKHLDKVPEGEKSPAMQRGEAIHKLAENFVKGILKKLPPELKLFTKEFSELKKAKASTEGKWAMDVAWKPADFFSWATAWCRVVLDAHFTPTLKKARVVDYKTGRIYGDNEEQMELYALSAFAHYPAVDEVDTELWYLDQPRNADNPKVKTFKRSQFPTLQKKWKAKVIPILTDKKFVARPGDYCGRCAYSARRNGPCKF